RESIFVISALRIETIASCSPKGGTGTLKTENTFQLIRGILAPIVVEFKKSKHDGVKRYFCKYSGSISFRSVRIIKTSHTAIPARSANQAFAKYGLSLPNSMSPLSKETPSPS